MCELLGIISKDRIQINDYLKEFFTHGIDNPHGWGIAVMNGNSINIEKEPECSLKSHYLKNRLSVPIKTHTAFAHIRYATVGNTEYANCHPFTKRDISGRRWVFMHNGTIFDYPELNEFTRIQAGDTDSERVLLYIISEINNATRKAGYALSADERFKIIDSLMPRLSLNNKLNLMIYDGEIFYVHKNCKDTMYFLEDEYRTIIATKPLESLNRGIWSPVVSARLLGFVDGTLKFKGTQHGNMYVPDPESEKYLYQIFSSL